MDSCLSAGCLIVALCSAVVARAGHASRRRMVDRLPSTSEVARTWCASTDDVVPLYVNDRLGRTHGKIYSAKRGTTRPALALKGNVFWTISKSKLQFFVHWPC